ncbi:MAG: MMPL family transporter [Spirochaetes bacterium]|nr:MMPL family transporter [Spirochaetota bacterium]
MKRFKHIILPKNKIHSIIFIVISSMLTLFFALGIFNIQIDNNVMSLLPLNKETRIEINKLNEFNKEFPGNQVVFIAISGNPFTLEKIKTVYDFTKELKNLDTVKSVISCFDMDIFKKSGNLYKIQKLSLGYPKNEEELNEFINDLDSHRYLKGTVLSYDKKSLGIIAYMNEKAYTEYKGNNILLKILKLIFPKKYGKKLINRSNFSASIENLISKYTDKLTIHYTGVPVYENKSKDYMMKDLIILMLPSLMVIIILLYLNFKTKSGVFLPVLIISMSVIWTLGLIGWLGIKLTVVGAILPSLIMIIGSSYTLHYLNSYYLHIGLYDDHDELIFQSTMKIFNTILYAALTTMVSFASFIFANIEAIKSFGLLIIFSIMITLYFTFFKISKLLSLQRLPENQVIRTIEKDKFSKVLNFFNRLVIPLKWLWAVLFFVCIVLFSVTLPNIKVETNFVNFFKKNDPVKKDILFIQENFKGTTMFNITLRSDRKDFFKSMEGLKAAEKIQKYIDGNVKINGYDTLGWNFSIITLLEEINKTMKGNYELPENETIVKRFLSFLKMGKKNDITSNLISRDYTSVNFTLRMFYDKKENYYFMTENDILKFYDKVKNDLNKIAEEDGGFKAAVWGEVFLISKISRFLTQDQRVSLSITIALVFMLTLLLFRSVSDSLFALVPLIFGVAMNFTIMSVFNIALDIATVMIAAIGIGIGVDNALHFIIHYNSYKKKYTSTKKIILSTLKYTSRPVMFTTLVLSAGFVLFSYSSFKPLKFFGILLAITLLNSTFATLFILPSFFYIKEMIVKKMRFIRRQ